MQIQIQPHDIHVWTASLSETFNTNDQDFALLSPDEQNRALRFRFPLHKQRYITGRATLRKILSLYLNIPATDITFTYNPQDKPGLANSSSGLNFNLSHSADLAIFAFTLNHDIGIDIEKIATEFNSAVASRYFSQEENALLHAATMPQQADIFYQLWARKEAIIKAAGKGLHIPLSSFSVSCSTQMETIYLDDQTWLLYPLSIHPGFAAALATNQKIHTIEQWIYFNHAPRQEKIIRV